VDACIPYTHTHSNAILLDSWFIPRDSTIPLVSLYNHRDAPTIPLRSLWIHRDAPLHQTVPSVSVTPLCPIPGSTFSGKIFTVFVLHILQETARQSVCAPDARLNPPEILSPCGLPLSCCLATSVVRLRFGVACVVFTRMFLGGMKSKFVPFHSQAAPG